MTTATAVDRISEGALRRPGSCSPRVREWSRELAREPGEGGPVRGRRQRMTGRIPVDDGARRRGLNHVEQRTLRDHLVLAAVLEQQAAGMRGCDVAERIDEAELLPDEGPERRRRRLDEVRE